MTNQYEPTDANFAGHAVIGKTAYRVHVLPVMENTRNAGCVAQFALVGPRGSMYLVTDWGKGFNLNSVCLGGGVSWNAQPRPLRGLTREHLSLFYEAA